MQCLRGEGVCLTPVACEQSGREVRLGHCGGARGKECCVRPAVRGALERALQRSLLHDLCARRRSAGICMPRADPFGVSQRRCICAACNGSVPSQLQACHLPNSS